MHRAFPGSHSPSSESYRLQGTVASGFKRLHSPLAGERDEWGKVRYGLTAFHSLAMKKFFLEGTSHEDRGMATGTPRRAVLLCPREPQDHLLSPG